MRHAEHDAPDMSDQDSFLDVVANMVGILILLVMVMGLRASQDVQPLAAEDAISDGADAVSDDQVRGAVRHALATGSDVNELVRRVHQVANEAVTREQERDDLNLLVAACEQEIKDLRAGLDSQQQEDFDLRLELDEARQTLDELSQEQLSVLSQEKEVEEVESLPTPLGKTVTGNEIHLRLADGHVSVVPLEELREEFTSHAERNAWRLRDQDELVSTVGPIDGFRLRYRLRKGEYVLRQGSGMERHTTMIRLVKWELMPVSEAWGESVEQALLPGSDLRGYLKSHPAESCTVTIWTYPNSFNDFRTLKRALFELGYATAGRPLPAGVPIGGSPQGTQSVAQ